MMISVRLCKYEYDLASSAGYNVSLNKLEGDIDITDYMLEDGDIKGNYRLEFNDYYKFTASGFELSFDKNSALDAVYEAYKSSLEYLWGLEVDLNGSPEFFGVIQRTDFTYDRRNETYHVKITEWLTFLNKLFEAERIPQLTDETTTLTDYLTEAYVNIGNLIEGVKIDVTLPQDYEPDYYNYLGGYITGEFAVNMSPPFTVTEMNTELLKYYGAYMFIGIDKEDGYKKKVFILNRQKTLNATAVVIDDLVLDEDIEYSNVDNELNGILLNIVIPSIDYYMTHMPSTRRYIGRTDYTGEWNGWWLITKKLQLQHGPVDDVSIIDKRVQYIDLRQNFRQYFNGNRFFQPVDDPETIYQDNLSILSERVNVSVTVDTLNLDVLSKVSLEGVNYQIKEVEKDYNNAVSQLTLVNL